MRAVLRNSTGLRTGYKSVCVCVCVWQLSEANSTTEQESYDGGGSGIDRGSRSLVPKLLRKLSRKLSWEKNGVKKRGNDNGDKNNTGKSSSRPKDAMASTSEPQKVLWNSNDLDLNALLPKSRVFRNTTAGVVLPL